MSRRKHKTRPSHGHDSHHLLWTRKTWDKGFKLLLRRAFVYDLPLDIHQQLHASVKPIPPLEEEEARWLWEQYKLVDRELDLFEALEWLRSHAPNSQFAIAIMAEQGFLQNYL